MSAGKGKVVRGGVPFGPDVDALMKTFPDIKPGIHISHDDISRVIREPYKSNRYSGVVDSWRRKLIREKNLELRAVRGEGFEVLTVGQRISERKHGYTKLTRAAVRLQTKNAQIDTRGEPEDVKKTQLLQQRLFDETVRFQQNSAKELAEPSATVTLPRLRPVG